MRKLYIVAAYSDDVGEVEGAFDQDGTLLDWWSANDAYWRHEYFGGFLARLGFDTSGENPEWLEAALLEHVKNNS